MDTLTSPSAGRCWLDMPRGVAVVALAAALSACGGGGTDVAAEESSADVSIAQNAVGADVDTSADTDPSAGIEASPDIEIDASTPLETDAATGMEANADTDNGAIAVGAAVTMAALPAAAPSKTACDSATGPVLQVGPGQKYTKPSAAATAARAGDVVRIAAGDYRGDVATWKANNLTICGSGGRARLFADGKSAGGKGIWVVTGSGITIDSMEFHQAKVKDKNGAGIRVEHKSGDLRIINSGFFDNENGILTAKGPITLTIERSEFARNSAANTSGQTHNIYVGAIDQVSVSGSFFHESRYGHNFKSRAKVSLLENNYLMDGPAGMSSYLADFPNGGKVVLRGNLMQKGPKAPNKVAIEYGAEGKRWDENSLEMVHNTVVMTRPSSIFLRVMPWAQSVALKANIWASMGNDPLVSGKEFALSSMVQQGNVQLPASYFVNASRIAKPDFWPNPTGVGLTGLPGVLDANYRYDTPAPAVLRAIASGARRAGALQSAP